MVLPTTATAAAATYSYCIGVLKIALLFSVVSREATELQEWTERYSHLFDQRTATTTQHTDVLKTYSAVNRSGSYWTSERTERYSCLTGQRASWLEKKIWMLQT